MKNALNFLLFQAAWWPSVLGAAAGHYWIGLPLVLLCAVVRIAQASDPRGETRLLLAITGGGIILDSALALAGVFEPRGALGPAWICPPWLAGLWLAFATTLRGSLGWLRGRPILAAVLGAPGGAFSYLAGARLGALDFPETVWPSLAVLFVVWAVVFPLTMMVSERCEACNRGEECELQSLES
ncbi:DUF2878 domain-containing protein [bacterium]|nr:DUF2878 domain-containing protein [bacterium]